VLDRRGRLLLTTLAFAGLRPEAGGSATKIGTLRRWLDTWPGIGAIVAGMAHQGYDVQLTGYDGRGWRTAFYPTGIEQSATSATRSAWEPAPWHATQRAAWQVLKKAEA